MGGEKKSGVKGALPPLGSPPRGRGKAAIDFFSVLRPRITPAWAGKRRPVQAVRPELWDHPRVGGEKRQARTYTASCQGSPPRGRGKETSPHLYCELSRITPAWAGKSLGNAKAWMRDEDHPRVGGEKLLILVSQLFRTGSPPRGRGKADKDDVSGLDLGITPAWAGKSSFSKP